MPDFRFRAAAALELRRQQEQAAGGRLSREEAQLREFKRVRDDAEAGRRAAQDQQQAQERRGTDAATLLWHRNWIVKLSGAVDGLSRDVMRQADTVRAAERAWYEARRRRLALERMRERAWRRYQDEQDRQELKVIDELARLRHAMKELGGPTRDD